MKKVKASDVAKGKWQLSSTDRLSLNSLETSKNVQNTMAVVAKSMESQIAIIDQISAHMTKMIEHLDKAPTRSPMATSHPAPVEVIIPPADKTKKKFRCTPVRDKQGLIEYVDIHQL